MTLHADRGRATPGIFGRFAWRLLILACLLLAGCRTPGTIPQDSALPNATATPRPDPYPRVRLPQDEGPHTNLTEWWYYTGHLDRPDGGVYGFQLTFFQVSRGNLPPVYIAHGAITDPARGRFVFDQKQAILRNQIEATGLEGGGFRLRIDDWTASGREGRDTLRFAVPGYTIDLRLTSTKPAVLHDGTGLIFYGPAGFSYYYSRTRMSIEGTIVDGGTSVPVRGDAWMDHQWGDFLTLIGGGWDWFSIQLEDGTDYMLYLLRDFRTGQVTGQYGTRVAPDGTTTTIDRFTIDVTSRWRSPHTGADYPAGWTIALPGDRLTLTPVLADQELRTQATSGLAYWEGAVQVSGQQANGRGYVELTGYAP